MLANEKYEDARGWYEVYHELVPADGRPDRKLNGLNHFWDYFLDSTIVDVSHLPLNTQYSEIAPVSYNDGILFVSARENYSIVDEDYFRKEDLYDLYYSSYDSASGWGEIVSFDEVLNTPFQEGPVSFFDDEKLLFTRSNYYDKRQTKRSDGKTSLQLYTAVKTGDIWANIQPFTLNDNNYTIAHPALNSTNDTLIFVSDMPGGFGGSDLYMTVFDGDWSVPMNLGSKVNTEGNELFPSFIASRLFFSSDGRDGIGGLDVYKATLENGVVKYVENIGVPINSSMDDFSYSIDPESKSGYFSSNRDGGKGKDDLYSHIQTGQVLQGIAVQEQNESPLAGVQVNLIQNGLTIATTRTGSDGSFRFHLPLASDFEITAKKDEHTLKSDVTISTRGNRIDIDSVILKMHKHDFFAKGLVYDSETQEVMNNVQVIIREDGAPPDTVVTGLDGLYSFVIEPGKDYSIWAEKDRFSSDSLLINTRSISKGIITNDFVLEEEYIEKKSIFFDYNDVTLRQDAIPDLQIIVEILKRHPNDWLIIGAHADSRGSKEYNLDLSERRAQTVVDYFLSRGVKREKIIARGFGEGLVLNRCTDGINCQEIDHSKNRRAEIVVEEKRPEEELENKGF